MALIAGTAVVAALLLKQNLELRQRIAHLESTRRSLLLSVVRHDPTYKLFIARFPEATCRFESGAARWSALVQTEPLRMYVLEFRPGQGTHLLDVSLRTAGHSAQAEQRVISAEEFSALTAPSQGDAGRPTITDEATSP